MPGNWNMPMPGYAPIPWMGVQPYPRMPQAYMHGHPSNVGGRPVPMNYQQPYVPNMYVQQVLPQDMANFRERSENNDENVEGDGVEDVEEVEETEESSEVRTLTEKVDELGL